LRPLITSPSWQEGVTSDPSQISAVKVPGARDNLGGIILGSHCQEGRGAWDSRTVRRSWGIGGNSPRPWEPQLGRIWQPSLPICARVRKRSTQAHFPLTLVADHNGPPKPSPQHDTSVHHYHRAVAGFHRNGRLELPGGVVPYRSLLRLLQVVDKSCFAINSEPGHTLGVVDASMNDREDQRQSVISELLDRRTERLLDHSQ
jgi:hypothetical protein